MFVSIFFSFFFFFCFPFLVQFCQFVFFSSSSSFCLFFFTLLQSQFGCCLKKRNEVRKKKCVCVCVACMCTLCSLLFGKAFVFRAKEWARANERKNERTTNWNEMNKSTVVCCIYVYAVCVFSIFPHCKSKHKFHIMAHFAHFFFILLNHPNSALAQIQRWIHCCFLLFGTPHSRFCLVI